MGSRKGLIKFLVAILVIAAMTATALVGLDLGFYRIPSVVEGINDDLSNSKNRTGIKLGLDLVGGSVITYEAKFDESYDTSKINTDMQIAQRMLRERLNAFGYTEATLSIIDTDRLSIEIPGLANPEQAISLLGSTAKLEFQDADGNTVLVGQDIAEAKASQRQRQSGGYEWVCEMTFKDEAIPKFAEATRAAASRTDGKNYISIVLDGTTKSSPSVREEINSSQAIIEFTGQTAAQQAKEAQETAELINIGQLPFELVVAERNTVSAQLGSRSLETSLWAGMIGLIIVILFMIVVYRLPGFVAAIALVFYTVLMFITLSIAEVNLSLPGMAGIILSIGMAVDSNIIIYERIKEELRAGKTLRSSIETGFKRGFAAVLDTHVTTFLASAVLWWQGTGPIIGFAIALFIGVILSMFTVLVVSRLLLRGLVDMNVKNLWAYGA